MCTLRNHPKFKELQASLAWARSSGNNGKVLVWGSSHSAALVFLHQQEVAGVLVFSPGEYLDAPDAVHDAATKVSIPIFVTSAKDRNEIAAAKSILAVAPAQQKTQFVRTLPVRTALRRCARTKSRRRIGKLGGCGGISRQF